MRTKHFVLSAVIMAVLVGISACGSTKGYQGDKLTATDIARIHQGTHKLRIKNKKASLRCIELATGELKWEEKSIGFGALMAAEGKLIVQTEKGELVVAKATPDAFDEMARAQVLSGRCWTTPVLAHGRLYVRNSAGLVKCLNLKKKG